MSDINRILKTTFHLAHNEDHELVITSNAFNGMEFHVDDMNTQTAQATLLMALQILYPVIFDCHSPETVMVVEASPHPNTLKTFQVAIKAPA